MIKSEVKNCQKCKKQFLITPQEKEFYTQKSLPAPLNCPECRRDRRRSLRNKQKLFKKTCDKCKIELMSTYDKDSPYIIYCEKCYYDSIGGVDIIS